MTDERSTAPETDAPTRTRTRTRPSDEPGSGAGLDPGSPADGGAPRAQAEDGSAVARSRRRRRPAARRSGGAGAAPEGGVEVLAADEAARAGGGGGDEDAPVGAAPAPAAPEDTDPAPEVVGEAPEDSGAEAEVVDADVVDPPEGAEAHDDGPQDEADADEPAAGDLDVADDADDDVEGAEVAGGEAEQAEGAHGDAEQAPDADEAVDDGQADGSTSGAGQQRRRRRRGGRRRGRSGADRPVDAGEGEVADAAAQEAPVAGDDPAATAPTDAADPAAEDPADAADTDDGARTRTRRRRTRRPAADAGGGEDAATDAPNDASDEATAQEDEETGAAAATEEPKKAPTRLQARSRGRGRSGRGRGKGGRRPIGGVSEETRRAIVEGPPRRMLVSSGSELTQVAVLEERTLVEHYVARKDDVSYVGNIYLGRVQNVLPGMEAAFVDVGKGRNGVLYAGEVLYDEADLDGELPRIEDRLKPGQTVLVQVTKDPMGTKGARLTQHLSIAGRYCVLAPGDGMLGISRKLTDDERERLRKILKAIKPEGFGLIVRTAAEGATKEQLEADVSRLTRIWETVQRRAEEVKPLDAVYEEPTLVMRVIRDVFGSEFSDLVVDSEDLAERIRDYLSDVSPEMVDKVAVHTGEERIFDAYEVTTQVRRALEKKVWLRSGGYLIIEKTEAMWVIDVNTGKFVGKDNLEETVLKNNLEAADEIARQLRLRDMGGIIVIDFVDMLVPANRDEVLKRFKRELARDKTKSRVMDISKLGLVQMTRKNVSQGLTETFTTTCETCEGRGATILDHAFH